MLHYLRLWRRFLLMAFVREAEYRVNFVIGVVEGLLQLGVAVASFMLLYRFTETVAGWSQAEVLMLAGIYRVVEGLIGLQIAPNLLAIAGYIRSGELDFLLLRPVSSQFLVSTRRLALPEAVNALEGLLLTIYAGSLAGVSWSMEGVFLAIAFCVCGLVLLYAFWFLSVTFSFWLQAYSLGELFYSAFATGRYPVHFFKGLGRALLTFVFPVAFATTFPTQALLGSAPAHLLPIGLGMAALALLVSYSFWNYAVRHYSSASS